MVRKEVKKEITRGRGDSEERIEHEVRTGQSNIESDLKDAGNKVKAGARAVGSKMENPDRDLETEYEMKKTEERIK